MPMSREALWNKIEEKITVEGRCYGKTGDIAIPIEWLDKFYRRMSNALYKWSIMPPSIIVDSRSINKHDYKQPITSSKINYKGISEKEISEKLKEFLLCQT